MHVTKPPSETNDVYNYGAIVGKWRKIWLRLARRRKAGQYVSRIYVHSGIEDIVEF